MAITDKRGINITSGFKLISPTPIDARFVVESEEELQSIIENGATYDGLEVWVKSLNSKVRYNGEKFVSTSDLGIEKVEREEEVVDEDFFKDTVVPINEGTKVQNSGTIGKVYFNTKLSIDEVKALIDSLTFSWSDTNYSKYYIALADNPVRSKGIAFYKGRGDVNSDFTYVIGLNDNSVGDGTVETRIWSSEEGWLLDNIELNLTLVSEYNGTPIGDQNDKLISVMSSTPFEKIERNYIYKGGTAVPNSGTINELYFNTNLSIEEVVEILKTLPYVANEQGYEMYNIFQANLVGTNFGLSYDVGKFGNIYGFMATTINDNGLVSQTVIFVSEEQEVIPTDFVGWNPTFLNNDNANTLDGGTLNIVSGGTSNDLLGGLISTTPFGKVLKEDLEIVEEGTAVPNSGTVEKVYVNTNLSVEEVNKIVLNNVKNELDNSKVFLSYFIADESHAYLCAIIDLANQKLSLISDGGGGIIYVSHENPDTDFVGWNPNFNGEITINSNLVTTFGSYNVGTFNSLLSNLISLTPFKGIKGGQIKHETIQFHPISKETGELDPSIKLFPRVKVSDLRTEGNQKYHISNVTFGKREISIEGNEEKWFGTAVPNSGTIEKVYLNNSLTNEEVCKIMDNLPFNESGQYAVLAVENNSYILCSKGETTGFEGTDYIISDWTKGKTYFSLSDGGWQEFENPIEINGTLITEASGIYIGTANDKVSPLISTTPFEKKKEIFTKEEQGLFHINRDGTPNFEKPVYLKYNISSAKSPVPNSGYVEKIKFDTSLSVEEIENIVNSLDNWFDIGDGTLIKFIVYNETSMVMIALAKVPGIGCGILAATEAGEVPIFSSSLELSQAFGYDAVGWHEDFTGEIECNCEVCDVAELSSAIDNESLVDIAFIGSGGNGLVLKLDDINSKQKGNKITSIIYNGVSYAIGEENSIGFEEVD